VADIGGNGRVDVFDALTVLNVALGFGCHPTALTVSRCAG
jgi:hypothetical protein